MVTRRGSDLVLVGGGRWGTIYAVYDFLENEAGYRNFGAYEGGERFVKRDTLVFSGHETRRRPAFDGFRDEHTLYGHPDKAAASRFFIRNRGNRNLHRGGGESRPLQSAGTGVALCVPHLRSRSFHVCAAARHQERRRHHPPERLVYESSGVLHAARGRHTIRPAAVVSLQPGVAARSDGSGGGSDQGFWRWRLHGRVQRHPRPFLPLRGLSGS